MDSYVKEIVVDSGSFEQDLYSSAYEQSAKGGWLRMLVAIIFILYTVIAFTVDITRGYYALKLFVLGSACMLIFSVQSYPFLLGLLAAIYFELKPGQIANPETTYMVQIAYVVTILMAIGTFVNKHLVGQVNQYQRRDPAMFCLFGLVLIACAGVLVMTNRFLFVRRLLEICGYACAYYVGKSHVKTLAGLRLLLLGLCLGIFAFLLPRTLGYVLKHGFSILGSLHQLRGEAAGESASTRSGIVVVAFAFAYSVSSGRFSNRTKLTALCLIAIPAVILILIYLSRAAILIVPIAIALTLFFSGRKRAAILTILIIAALGFLARQFLYEWSGSIETRMTTLYEASMTRQYIWQTAARTGLAHPLFGIGGGQFRLTTGFWHAHNDILNLLCEHGIIAVTLYVMFWIYLTNIVLRLRLNNDILVRNFAGSFLVVMSCYFIYSQIEPMYFNRGGLLFTFLAGMMVRLYNESRMDGQFEVQSLLDTGADLYV